MTSTEWLVNLQWTIDILRSKFRSRRRRQMLLNHEITAPIMLPYMVKTSSRPKLNLQSSTCWLGDLRNHLAVDCTQNLTSPEHKNSSPAVLPVPFRVTTFRLMTKLLRRYVVTEWRAFGEDHQVQVDLLQTIGAKRNVTSGENTSR